jgi:hypothetical protein
MHVKTKMIRFLERFKVRPGSVFFMCEKIDTSSSSEALIRNGWMPLRVADFS